MAKKKDTGAGLIERTKALAAKQAAQRLDELVALIRRRMTEIVEAFYDIGEALREIVDKKLYGVGGDGSLKEFLEKRGLMSLAQANRLIAIVRKVPRAQALTLGQTKAYALVSYTAATPEPDSPKGLLEADATVGDKPVSKASARDIDRAAEAARAKRPKTPAAKAKQKETAALEKGLRAVLLAAGIARPEVKVGDEWVTVTLTRAAAERAVRGR